MQLPLFNERAVAARIIEAAGALDWPADKLEIQVLDDSTDATVAVVDDAVAELRARGVDAHVVRRDDRVGFKAGALEAATRSWRKGELSWRCSTPTFVPTGRTSCDSMVPHFAPGVGMVQARWGHLNARRELAHPRPGHPARRSLRGGARGPLRARGCWFNFNGTAGIWRREAIAEAGGWQHDTLTEDLDLSYRAQLAGWRFVYLDDVVAPAELPPTMRAFKAQQHRWAKGGVQTSRKLLPTLLRAACRGG